MCRHLSSGSLFNTGKFTDQHMQTYAHTHHTHIHMQHKQERVHLCIRCYLPVLLYKQSLSTFRSAALTSAVETLCPPKNSSGAREEAVLPPAPWLGWCSALCSLPKRNRFQISPLNPQWGMTVAAYYNSLWRPARSGKELQLTDLDSKTTEISVHDSVCGTVCVSVVED